MNYITIENNNRIQELYQEKIYLSGSILNYKKELFENAWVVSFEDNFFNGFSFTELELFVKGLIEKRSHQFCDSDALEATFYMWFDEQAFQLRFNILSGVGITLPFGCKVNPLFSYKSIIKSFFDESKKAMTSGVDISRDEIIFVEDNENLIDEKVWVQDVYVLEWKK